MVVSGCLCGWVVAMVVGGILASSSVCVDVIVVK